MKYQNLHAFQKHLSNASSQHLCRAYLAVVPDDYERAKVIQSIRSYVPLSQSISFNGPESACRDISDALLSPSLFGGEPVVIVDEVEKMSKKELQSLASLVENRGLCGYLFCGSRSKTILTASFEKAGVVLDLAEEKPWDRDKRLAEQLADRAARAGKRLDFDAAPLLFERLGSDPALLDGELDKLICYVGDRPTIGRSDIMRVCGCSRMQTLWAAAEEMVWEKKASSVESGSFYGLIPALRSQFSLGLKIISLIAEGCPREEWVVYLPKIWPKTLEKRIGQAQLLGAAYFQKGLDLLLQIELLSRTGQTNELALLDLFRCSLGVHLK